jgi:hypothetical protein
MDDPMKKLIVLYSLTTVALHYKASNDPTRKASRLIEWPRTEANIACLKAMAEAGNASLDASVTRPD